MSIRASVISGAALLGLVSIVPLTAVAAKADTSLSVTVLYGDLDISNKEGAEQLYLRLQSAARRVCLASMAHPQNRVAPACYRQVLTQAVRDVKAPEVTEVHARALRDDQFPRQLVGGSSNSNLSK
jgi:UrcA family protein